MSSNSKRLSRPSEYSRVDRDVQFKLSSNAGPRKILSRVIKRNDDRLKASIGGFLFFLFFSRRMDSMCRKIGKQKTVNITVMGKWRNCKCG